MKGKGKKAAVPHLRNGCVLVVELKLASMTMLIKFSI
jgi:hypothetical protein